MPIMPTPDDEPTLITPRRRMSPWLFIVIGCAGCSTVVLVGVTLMGTVLIPALHQRGQSARRASCVNNLKQLSMGLLMYTQDYDDRMPPAATWSQGLLPYTKNLNVFVCPQRPLLPGGYAFNNKLDYRPMKKIANPSITPTLFESTLGVLDASDRLGSFTTPHNGKGYVAFADGHVKNVAKAPSSTAGLAKK